jgi:hypothetical protein
LETPNFEQNASESEWRAHLARLSEWKDLMPNSITARIALAKAWVSYGWEARGSETIDKISEDSLQLFQSRVNKGLAELLEAKKLGNRCPQWYEAMLDVGLAQGWSRGKYDQIFEEGFHLEPTYYHLLRQKIIFLLPQWNGHDGDLGSFISISSYRIGGDEGDIMYFELISTVQHVSIPFQFQRPPTNWERIRKGYAAMKRIYGVDAYRRNLFMFYAVSTQDWQAADDVLKEIGDDWDRDVWGSKENFYIKKAKVLNETQHVNSVKIP